MEKELKECTFKPNISRPFVKKVEKQTNGYASKRSTRPTSRENDGMIEIEVD